MNITMKHFNNKTYPLEKFITNIKDGYGEYTKLAKWFIRNGYSIGVPGVEIDGEEMVYIFID